MIKVSNRMTNLINLSIQKKKKKKGMIHAK